MTDAARLNPVVELNSLPMEDRVIVRSTDTAADRFLVEQSPRWVRVVVGGIVVADSKRVLYLDEAKHMPVYYFPIEDVRSDLFEPSTLTKVDPVKGPVAYHALVLGERRIENAAWSFDNPVDEVATPLKGHVAFYWHKMDQWFEEDDEVYVHPRDPRHRVDVLNSSRHVQVIVNGEVVADTHRPRMLFETNLPARYYIPRADVRADLLVDSPTTSQCPYKGVASYYSVKVGDGMAAQDIVWYYRYPLVEASKMENFVCFFNERVDAIIVDGVEIEKPQTPWAKKPRLIPIDA